jgi:hypothetical protein
MMLDRCSCCVLTNLTNLPTTPETGETARFGREFRWSGSYLATDHRRESLTNGTSLVITGWWWR